MVNTAKSINRNEIKWKSPIQNFNKLNFDGASKRNPEISRIGYVIRIHQGRVIKGGFERIPKGTNNVTKAQALLYGVRLANYLKLKKKIIEGDSINTILACRNPKDVN